MDISHLYHDAAFGDPTLELDVKEQLKTREVNAREERNLQRMYESYDRSMFICEKETAWERWKVGQSLHGIWQRSPRLEKRLAVEKARIEALERSILYRNYRMNTNMTDSSFMSRQFTSVSLKPLHDQKKTQQGKHLKKRDKTSKESNGSNNNTNSERVFVRQADFVRRSEHSIKALAKLNWKQQNRRRDHEKFKEELFFHSKPVIEKAKVVLKGRSDIDVENLYSEFENILLPPVRKPANLDNSYRSFSRHQGPSNLSERNVLRLMDSVEPKPHPSPLAPVAEKSESEGKDKPNVESKHQNIEKEIKRDTDTQNNNIDYKMADSHNSSSIKNSDCTTSNQSSLLPGVNETLNTNDSERTRLPSIYQNNIPENEKSTNEKTEPETHYQSNSLDTPKTSQHVKDTPNTGTNSYPPEPFSPPNHTEPFSPSLSVSQVIMEEDEDELEDEKACGNPEIDVNNNAVPDDGVASDKSETERMNLFTMTCTTGLPQIWKQTAKPKEKVVVEVSAAAIARKHRRKRKDRW